ncbi:Putative peptidase S53, activation domain, Sedolisin domain, peptidase S8/S53 domain superfamily [Colletotrichum destructivum]|uniref:Peptidase S53, activation domain, Sedolisin domain, peptidase S8/S53 domain superfamily n=1 Tax=Colletotrichum destructivum TaxID=34406 RepID=A0AAX4IHN2_9PEZI|nr:Putative peptidase S53, activation domain, Sedolisin domain, peptidase S8/S53 domain superfamily [Colletotrichum destructivum]
MLLLRLSRFLTAAWLTLGTLGAPSPRDRVIPRTHELHQRQAPSVGQKWTKTQRLSDHVVLPVRIGLKQSNLEAGHDKLMDIANPHSTNYGKHMSPQEVIDFFAPAQTSVDIVVDWLVDCGISRSRIGQSANRQDGSQDIATEEYHIPVHVHEHIDYVTPGTRLRSRSITLPKPGKAKRGHVKPAITPLPGFPSLNATSCDTYITAECTRAQYGIPNGTTSAAGNELGIFEAQNSHYSLKDFDILWSTLYPSWDVTPGTYPEERLIDGAIGAIEEGSPVFPTKLGLESALDFDIAWPLIHPQKPVLYQVDDQYYEYKGSFEGFFNTFLDAIDGSYCTAAPSDLDPVYPNPHYGGYKGALQCGVFKPTNVISISYVGIEAYLPDAYQERQCHEWMKLALQGTTVVMAAGDNGVGGEGSCECECLRGGAGDTVFMPTFAGNCPYVLSVGATELNRASSNSTPSAHELPLHEVASVRISSGGGFSNVFPTPDYQKKAVRQYLDTVAPDLPFSGYEQPVKDGDFTDVRSGVYNRVGRGFPDVAAVGDRAILVSGGKWYVVGGTSMSAPIWASVLTLINEERIAAGQPTLGFVHPILYAHPEVFNDIIEGSNPGCNSTGFTAAKGWDPVTGLGSPNFDKLRKLLTGT